MTFTSPLFLLLLLLIPLAVWMGKPSLGASRGREWTSLILRLTILLCLIFSLAGLEIVQSGNELAVVFLLDVSDSMPDEAVKQEIKYVSEALSAMGADDQSAVVLFGADALVERPMSAARELGAITSAPVTNQTDLAEAIRMGMALFPSGAAKRMVILSDGAQTSGDAISAAEFAASSGVEIVVVPFINQIAPEGLITNVDAPTDLRENEQFELHVSVQTNNPMRATIRVLAGNALLYEQSHLLRRGVQTLSLPLTAGESGFISYQVQIDPEQDVYYQNNRLDAFSQIEGPPRILLVAPKEGEKLIGGETRPNEYTQLKSALDAARYRVNVVEPAFMPSDLPSLAQYNSIVLVDVPARDLNNAQMQILQSYVRDLGGGLMAVGGPTSFGVGGYYQTPLEEILPVDMQIKDEKRRPTLAIVFIIDHSGSMDETSGGVTKLELAKEAAARSVELLFPTDRVGVIAFDDSAAWVVPMTDMSDLNTVTNAIGSIRSGGGTDIMSGIQAMSQVLPNDPATVKHVILLTDGGADPTGIPELVEKLYKENNITLSTVGIGNGAADFLDDLALIGGGRYHFSNDASSIPSIFTEETALATRSYIVEETFFPTLVNSSPILANINSIPQLKGYVATSAKDLAQVILESEKGDPILAQWQYGLGRAVAFTSDATGRWAKNWVGWQNFPTFWTQAIRYTLGDIKNNALETTIQLDGEHARLTLDALANDGAYLNGYAINANIIAPDGSSQNIILRQIAPGRYQSNFTPTEQGVYLIRLTGENGKDGFAETTGWALSYSPEYKRIDSDPDLLLRLATIAGGQLASPTPADIFTHNLSGSRASRPIWQWLLLIAVLLFPLDIAIRRLIITRTDVINAKAWIKAKVNRNSLKVEQEAQRSESMEAMFKVKKRVKEADPLEASSSKEKVETIAPSKPKKSNPAPTQTKSTTEALLARKKNLKKEG